MHIQQSQHHQYGQTAGEDTGPKKAVLEDIPKGLVRRATTETAGMATDHNATRVIPGNTRSKHRIHEKQFRRGQRTTNIQRF